MQFSKILNYTQAIFKDGVWSDIKLVSGNNLNIPVYSSALHYGQVCFEGLKAYRNKNGKVHVFRPFENWHRINCSAQRLMMPQVPEPLFIDSISKLVKSNEFLVPKYRSGGSFYLRPVLFGLEGGSAVRPTDDYCLIVMGFPANADDYYKSLRLVTSGYHRAAPAGTGHIKAAGNYASVFIAHDEAKKQGYDECIYLDPVHNQYIEEIGAANFLAIKENTLIIPKSSSILPSITQKTIVSLATHLLHLDYVELKVNINEIGQFDEVAACGTAANLVPVTSITHKNTTITYSKFHTTFLELKEHLTQLQYGDLDEHPYFQEFNYRLS